MEYEKIVFDKVIDLVLDVFLINYHFRMTLQALTTTHFSFIVSDNQ